MRVFDLKSIPGGDSFEGYIWMSDAELPVVIDGTFDGLELNSNSNPFVIEAQLFDKKNRISYSVRYVDGQYTITKQAVNKQEIEASKEFLSKWDSHLTLQFYTRWEENNDPLCCNMIVLEPAELSFVGFKK